MPSTEKIKELHWKDARSHVKKVNEKLAKLIDQFGPNDRYSFIKAQYAYGSSILKKGVLQLPSKEGNIPFNHASIPCKIQKKLNYSSVPVGLILTRSVEVFFETEERCMPSKFLETGSMFGLWESFDKTCPAFIQNVWNLSAGARTLFLLPSISDAIYHGRLKRKHGIQMYPPKNLLEHYKVFKELSNAAQLDSPWECEILFFIDKWLEDHEKNLACNRLHKLWLMEAWQQSYNCRNKMSYDVAWEEFSREIYRRNYKPRAHIINIIKHLLAIGEGVYPGFSPVELGESAAPTSMIMRAYAHDYLLKYHPFIMKPHHLRKKGECVYYSLSLPTQLEYTPQAKNSPSIIANLREIKSLMDILLGHIQDKKVSYEYFHAEHDQFGEIKRASEIPFGDPTFQSILNQHENALFCDNSTFWQGCIRIKLNQDL